MDLKSYNSGSQNNDATEFVDGLSNKDGTEMLDGMQNELGALKASQYPQSASTRQTNTGLCLNCFKKSNNYGYCSNCGFTAGLPPEHLYHLHPGTFLNERYTVGTVLGFGGFGVTYKAWDGKLNTVVAIKEFYPAELVSRNPGEKYIFVFSGDKEKRFRDGLCLFTEEAKNLAKFFNDPNIVDVLGFFEQNNTAYIVMEFLDGKSLKDHLATNGGKLDLSTTLEIIYPVIEALDGIHKQGLIHRDVSPDNIFITVDKKYKLLDFGSVRSFERENSNFSQAVVKDGYTAHEQFSTKSKQGSYTDIYSLGATMYHMLTGEMPVASAARVKSIENHKSDPLKKPSELVENIPKNIELAILKAMSVQPELRFQKISEFKDAIYSNKWRKRGIASLIVGIAAVLLFAAVSIYHTALIPTLSSDNIFEDTITAWIPVDAGNEVQVYENLAKNFIDDYSIDIAVNIIPINEATYENNFKEAYTKQEQPTLFRADKVAANMDAISLEPLVNTLNLDDYAFISNKKKYAEYYPDMNIIPIGFSPVVVYENSIVTNQMSANDKADYKAQEHDFSDAGLNMLADNIIPYLIGDMAQYRKVQSRLPGYYEIMPFETEGNMVAKFKDEWGISNNSTDNQQKIAMLFLRYLLSDEAQSIIHVQNDNAIPLNMTTFETFVRINNKFDFVKERLHDFTLIKN